ncbi:MAG: tetratricopeptide repeat protein, partial [bacterium]|nr:tetratricopeptide repeat protein [bacterium]
MRSWLLAAVALLSACSPGPSTRDEALPPLPEVNLDAFLPAIREEVEKALDAATAEPEDPALVGELGMVLHAHQQNAAAEACYDRARALAPDEFRWVYLLGDVRVELGKTEQAIAHFRRALDIDPSYVPARLKLADALLKKGDLAEAERFYTEATEAAPDSAIAFYGLGRVRAAKGDSAAAAASHSKAVELFPDYGAAHYALGLAYRRLDRGAEAKKHFALGEKHKLDMPPTGDRVLIDVRRRTRSAIDFLRAGVELEADGKLDESLEVHLEALKIDPSLEQAHINLISLYARSGNLDQAVSHYQKAIELNPNLPDCHYNYGIILFNQKRFGEARAAFRKALEINPYYAKAHHNLGIMLEGEGNLDEAANHYRQAIDNEPGYRLAHFHLGRILVNQGRNREAITHFQGILEPEDKNTP